MEDKQVINLNDPMLYLKMAVKSLDEDDYEKGITRYLRAIDLSFDKGYKGIDNSLLGLMYLRTHNYKEAICCFYRSIAYGSKQSLFKVHMMIVQAFVSDKKLRAAQDYVNFLLKIKVIDEETKAIILDNFESIITETTDHKYSSQQNIKYLIKQAIKHINQKDFTLASEYIVKAKSLSPGDVIVNYLYDNIDEAFSGSLTQMSKLQAEVVATKINLITQSLINKDKFAMYMDFVNISSELNFVMEYGNEKFNDIFFERLFEYGAGNQITYLLEDLLFNDYEDKLKLQLLYKLIERRHIQTHYIRYRNILKIIAPIYFNGNEKLYFKPYMTALDYLIKVNELIKIDLLYIFPFLDRVMNKDNISYLEDSDTCSKIIIYKYLTDCELAVPRSLIDEKLSKAIEIFNIKKRKAKPAPKMPENVIKFPIKDKK